MRKTPFSFKAKPKVIESTENDNVTDIGDLLKRRPKEEYPEPHLFQTTVEPTQVKQNTRPEDIEPQQPQTEPAEFEETPIKHETKISEPMFNPEGLAKSLVDIANIARNWLYPNIYDRIVFNDFERRDLFDVHRKVSQAKKQGNEPELTEYEKELKEKYDELVKAKQKIDFKESERALIAKNLARHLEKIDFMKRIEKYDWVLILFALEGLRFAELRKIKNMNENA